MKSGDKVTERDLADAIQRESEAAERIAKARADEKSATADHFRAMADVTEIRLALKYGNGIVK